MALTPHQAHLLGEIHANLKTLVKSDEDKEQRLRVLERARWKNLGAMGLLALAAPAVVPMLAKLGLPVPNGH